MKYFRFIFYILCLSGVLFIADIVNAATYKNLNLASGFATSNVTTNSGKYSTSYRFGINTIDLTTGLTNYTVDWTFKTPLTVVSNSVVRFNGYFTYEQHDYTNCTAFVDTGCSYWNTDYTNTYSIFVVLVGSNGGSSCTVTSLDNGSYSFECPIGNGMTNVKTLGVRIFKTRDNFKAPRKTGSYGISYDWEQIIDDGATNTKSIIDNQNKNAQQAHTDSQNEVNATTKNTEAVNNASKQAHTDSQNEVNATNKNTEAVNNMNDTISDSNVDVDGSFFSGFDNNTHGLTGIITAPLQLIGSITSSKCSPLGIPIPFVEQTVQLPCMSTIYTKYFGEFFNLYQTITFGMIAYWVCVKIMFMVKGFKDPDSDRIEVLDL